MNRIDKTIEQAQKKKKAILSPYITAGDPKPDLTVSIMQELVRQGADIIELGIPFSDPMAEGPVIQQAMDRALAHQVHCDDVFEMVRAFRKSDQSTAIVLMGYLNPIEQYGYERFAKKAHEVGVDGTILVDLPPEESETLLKIWEKNKLYPIFLCSPTSTAERMKLIKKTSKGYVYYVSLKGVTGASSVAIDELKIAYEERKAQLSQPLMVGFGIKTAEMAKAVAQFADGVIVGAALISSINEAYEKDPDQFLSRLHLISDMRKAIDLNGL